MDSAAFRDSYSQPIGPGGAYAPPPYLYRGVQDIFIAYEADPAGSTPCCRPGSRPPTRSPSASRGDAGSRSPRSAPTTRPT